MNDCQQPVLDANRLTKSFSTPRGPVEVLHDVTLSVTEGEFLAITGPSGSGKTTFLNQAALLDRPSSGGLSFLGHDLVAATEDEVCRLRRESVGMVFQQFCLLPRRTVIENVMFRFRYLDVDEQEARDAAVAALDELGLGSVTHQQARLLSGGEMQRTAIARAIAVPPRLLIVDEPTGNLDRSSSSVVMDTFRKLNTRGITILMVTHNESILDYCTRRVVCEAGRIVEESTTT